MNEHDLKDFELVSGKEIFASGIEGILIKILNRKNDKLYLLKQVFSEDSLEKFGLVIDYVVSLISKKNNINLPQAYFLPSAIGNNLKIKENTSAIVIEFIYSETVSNLQSKGELPEEFSLWQVIHPKFPRNETKYLLSLEEGMSRRVLESIIISEQLAKICALDTFVSNSDRNDDNIIIDDNNIFYGIDQSCSLSSVLGKIALKRLGELKSNNYFQTCDKKILESLKIYNDTLKQLVTNISVEEIIEELDKLVPFLNCSDGEKEILKDDMQYYYGKNIRENINYCKKLVDFVDKEILVNGQ